ncbi:MAG: hypothetical protein FWG25_00340 [Promicromonosporaceae bacterium]|nr:hypothetical protein [Promicromonosporaceae bacterium]
MTKQTQTNPKTNKANKNTKAKAIVVVGMALTGTMLFGACASETAAAAGDISNEWVPGPLDEFNARIWGWDINQNETQQEAQARMDQESREMEEAIAACMAELGFAYNPRDDAGGTIIIWDDSTDGPQWGTLAFAEEFGYGISTDPWGRFDEADREFIEWVDPNQDILDAMSDSEREAWQEALWGPPMVPNEDGTWPEWDPMNAGCQGQAQGDRWMRQTPDEFLSLEEEMNNIWASFDNDPRITTLNSSWVTCMSNAGFAGYTSPNDANNELWNEWSELQGWSGMDDVWLNWDWDLHPEGPTFPEPDPAAVEAFTAREIEIAVADWTCRDNLRFNAVTQEVNHDIQQQFVDRHRAELEAWAQFEEARRG